MLKICVVGCGYVGMPLLQALRDTKKFQVVGYDLKENLKLDIYSNIDMVRDYDVYIMCLPTPVTEDYKPDILNIERTISKLVSNNRKRLYPLFVFESTWKPGTTRELCRLFNIKNFGYSPERINPGDDKHTLKTVTKIISASSPINLAIMREIYSSVVDDVYETSSIEVAEASKLIENTQRDINIAFINQISALFSRSGIDTLEVLRAAKTKWNFVNVSPGLVGGHCIGVDPYYLIDYGNQYGVDLTSVETARNINENYVDLIYKKILYTARRLLATHEKEYINIHFEGYTFKGNCDDTRNSKTLDIIERIRSTTDMTVSISDYFVACDLNKDILFANNVITSPLLECDILVLLVNHDYIKAWVNNLLDSSPHPPLYIIDLHGVVDEKFLPIYKIWRP